MVKFETFHVNVQSVLVITVVSFSPTILCVSYIDQGIAVEFIPAFVVVVWHQMLTRITSWYMLAPPAQLPKQIPQSI